MLQMEKNPDYYLFLDANIWINEQFLTSSSGEALIYHLKNTNGLIALPSLTRREVTTRGVRNLEKLLKDREKVKEALKKVNVSISDDIPPSNDELVEVVEGHLEEQQELIFPIEHTFEQMQAALDRVIQELPPNVSTEQFRDSLLWEIVLDYGKAKEIHFITNDTDFYERGSNSKQLAKHLENELTNSPYKITVFPDLRSYLHAMQAYLSPPKKELILNLLIPKIMIFLEKNESRYEFLTGELTASSIEAIPTTINKELALTFSITLSASNIKLEDATRVQGYINVSGNCKYKEITRELDQLYILRVEYIGLDNNPLGGSVYLYGAGAPAGN